MVKGALGKAISAHGAPSDAFEALLAAATAIVAEVGPEGLKISAVARRAGVSREEAHSHFGSRDEIVSALNSRIAEEITAMFSVDADLSEFCDFLVEYVVFHPEVARLWMYLYATDNLTQTRASEELYHRFVSRLVEGDGAAADIDVGVLGSIVLSSALTWSLLANAEARDDGALSAYAARFSRELKRMLLHGAVRPEKWQTAVATVSGVTSPVSPPLSPKPSR